MKKWTGFAFGAFVLIGVLVRFVLYYLTKATWGDFYTHFHTRFDAFAFGILAAYIFIIWQKRPVAPSRLTGVILAAASITFLGLTFLYGGFGGGYFNMCWQFTLTGAGFAMLILLLMQFRVLDYLPFRAPVAVVAKLSYSMYLYHMLAMLLLINFSASYFAIDNRSLVGFLLLFVFYFITLMLVSGISYLVVERPFMNLRKRYL